MILDVSSKRKRQQPTEPLVRDALPHPFRVQVSHIMLRALGANDFGSRLSGEAIDVWRSIHDWVAEEHGLPLNNDSSPRISCINYLCGVKNVEHVSAEDPVALSQLSSAIAIGVGVG